MRGSWKVREWQKVKRRTDTEWDTVVRQSHPPKPCRVSHKGIRRPLCFCPAVCLHWLTRSSCHWHPVPYGPSQTHITSLLLHTHVAAGRSGNCSSAQHLQDYSTQHLCQSERGACFFHWVNYRIGKTTKGLFLSGCEEFWVLITQRVLCTAEPHSTSIWWTSSIETLHADCLN